MDNKKSRQEDQSCHVFGKELQRIRKEKKRRNTRLNQRAVSKMLGYSVSENTKGGGEYSMFERGQKWIPREKLLIWKEKLDLSSEEWEQIRDLYLPREANSLDYIVFNKTTDDIERPPSLGLLAYKDISSVPSYHPLDIRRWRENTFRFGRADVIINVGIAEGFQFSVLDTRAYNIMQYLLGTINIEGKFDDGRSASFQDLDRDLILIGGPGRNNLSKKINEILSKEPWFDGFYFLSEGNIAEDWTIFHKKRPEFKILHSECFDDKPVYTYRILEDKGEQDFALIYIGPNPANMKMWMIIVAGLGRIGTYGAAEVFNDNRFTEYLGNWLINNRRYCSVLVRYRFYGSYEDMHEGSISSILLTKGYAP